MFDLEREDTAGNKTAISQKLDKLNKSFPANLIFQVVLSLTLLSASKLAVPAQMCDREPSASTKCPTLLLDRECRAFKASLASAATPKARETVRTHYDLLLKERERACPCDAGHEWIRLSKSPAARLTVSLLSD